MENPRTWQATVTGTPSSARSKTSGYIILDWRPGTGSRSRRVTSASRSISLISLCVSRSCAARSSVATDGQDGGSVFTVGDLKPAAQACLQHPEVFRDLAQPRLAPAGRDDDVGSDSARNGFGTRWILPARTKPSQITSQPNWGQPQSTVDSQKRITQNVIALCDDHLYELAPPSVSDLYRRTRRTRAPPHAAMSSLGIPLTQWQSLSPRTSIATVAFAARSMRSIVPSRQSARGQDSAAFQCGSQSKRRRQYRHASSAG